MWQSLVVSLFGCLLVAVYGLPENTPPAEVARAVGQAFLDNELTFINWEGGFQYGPAIVVDGLYDVLDIVDKNVRHAWEVKLSNDILERYYDRRNSNCSIRFPYGKCTHFRRCAYAILNVPMPFTDPQFGTVGDLMNLFPIGYLRRYALNNTRYSADLTLAQSTVEKYVLPYPSRLTTDGTFSRTGGCCVTEPVGRSTSSFLWADDQYMGLALMARLVPYLPDGEAKPLLKVMAQMQQQFVKHMYDTEGDGLIHHGAFVNETESLRSCCKWGRANGWGAMSHMEILTALERYPNHPNRPSVLNSFRAFVDSMLHFQNHETGRWHQVVNESSTFLETSVTAMMTTVLATGIYHGWLSDAYYDATRLAWNGLLSQIESNGTVLNVCMGTGIMPNVAGYNGRGRDYWQSSPGGVGTVLRAAKAMSRLTMMHHQDSVNK